MSVTMEWFEIWGDCIVNVVVWSILLLGVSLAVMAFVT